MTKSQTPDTPPHCGTAKLRLYVEADLSEGASVDTSNDQAHYLRNVMRAAPGTPVLLFNGRHGEWRATIKALGKKTATLKVESQTRPFEPLPDIWLLFAPVKRARLDFIAQKATEMGAARIQPVLTARTQVTRVNRERLYANAVEAAEQCGLVTVPEVADPIALSKLLDGWDKANPNRRILFCDETAPPGSTMKTLTELGEGADAPWALLIGPEGGFSAEERDALLARPDTVGLSLGPRIMRADTAIVAGLTALQLFLGDWQGDWQGAWNGGRQT